MRQPRFGKLYQRILHRVTINKAKEQEKRKWEES